MIMMADPQEQYFHLGDGDSGQLEFPDGDDDHDDMKRSTS